MFEQHPVPQQISSYQFRLVGDMTLKQFFQLAGGAVISLLIYASPILAIFKWPLIIFFALAGAALAFLPLEDRPLDRWVVAFFRSVYSPTIFKWKQADTPPVYFQVDTPPVPGTINTPTNEEPSQSKPTFLNNLENAEKSFLSSVTGLFSGSNPKASIPPTQSQKEEPRITPIIEEVVVPQAQPVQVAPKPQIPLPTTPVQIKTQAAAVGQTLQNQAPQVAQAAQFSPEATPPLPPSQPNVIVGQVMDFEGKIVDGAILEIKDTYGRPVRALKTNKAGHFLIVTPLTNGQYQITTEKEGYDFEPLTLNTKGEIIPPIAIKANKK